MTDEILLFVSIYGVDTKYYMYLSIFNPLDRLAKMSGGDLPFQYVPLDKLKVYRNHVLVNSILRKLNFSTQFALTEVPGTDSVDIDVSSSQAVPQVFDSYIDLQTIATPADPPLDYIRIYAKKIDTNNYGWFAKTNLNSSIVEVRIF